MLNFREFLNMTDLISREAAIALLDAEKVNAAETGCATDEAYNLAIGHCIEALTNMPIAEIGLPYVKFDADLLATLRDCKSAVVTIQEKP